jgi:hypothetical protein
MRNSILFIFIGVVIVSSLSCSHSCEPIAYIQYVNNPKHNLVNEQVIAPLKYSVTFQSADYTIIKQLGVNQFSKEAYQELKKQKEDYIQFDIKIQSSKESNNSLFKTISKSTEQYLELIQYFENAKNDFIIELDNQPIELSTYYFVPNQGFSNSEEIVLGTTKISEERLKKSEKIKIIYDDKIFGHGRIYFTFYIKDILKTPTLKL